MTATLCPNCHHDIDRHELDEPCLGCLYALGGSGEEDLCQLRPSDVARALLDDSDAQLVRAAVTLSNVATVGGEDAHEFVRIARALLTAEPTEADVEAVVSALSAAGHKWWGCSPVGSIELTVRAALKAAREARA